MIALPLSIGLLLDWCFGEPRRWHPLVGFGRLVSAVEARMLSETTGPFAQRLAGLLAWLLLVAPPVLLVAWGLAAAPPVVGPAVSAIVLYGALGGSSLARHARAVARPLAAGDLGRARRQVAMLVSRDTESLDESGVARAAVESVLENGNDAVVAPLFWFAVAGAPGVLGYRLANTLDARWGYRTKRYRHFGRAAARLDDGLNWLPARFCALGYGLASGRLGAAWRCWRRQAPLWESPNAGPVMAAGAGALAVRLGGAGHYHGAPKSRPVLGTGNDATAADIERAVTLVTRTTVLWAVAIVILELVLTGGWHPWH